MSRGRDGLGPTCPVTVVTHLWACEKNIFQNQNSNTKEINKRKEANYQQNLAVFLAVTDSENKII